VRQQPRPRYGFYVDHMVDAFGSVALMCGLGLSGLIHWPVAVAMLVGFLLLAGESFLATYTLGEFHLSFFRFGPTELRVLLAIGNLALFSRPYVLGGHRLFDIGGMAGIAGMSAMFVFFTAKNIRRLYREERIR